MCLNEFLDIFLHKFKQWTRGIYQVRKLNFFFLRKSSYFSPSVCSSPISIIDLPTVLREKKPNRLVKFILIIHKHICWNLPIMHDCCISWRMELHWICHPRYWCQNTRHFNKLEKEMLGFEAYACFCSKAIDSRCKLTIKAWSFVCCWIGWVDWPVQHRRYCVIMAIRG